jgi:hypothetical protein
LQDFDPQDVPTEVGVGTNTIVTPKKHHNDTPFTYKGTPSRVNVGTTPDHDEHMLECAQDDVDAEHGFAYFEAWFP